MPRIRCAVTCPLQVNLEVPFYGFLQTGQRRRPNRNRLRPETRSLGLSDLIQTARWLPPHFLQGGVGRQKGPKWAHRVHNYVRKIEWHNNWLILRCACTVSNMIALHTSNEHHCTWSNKNMLIGSLSHIVAEDWIKRWPVSTANSAHEMLDISLLYHKNYSIHQICTQDFHSLRLNFTKSFQLRESSILIDWLSQSCCFC